mmetsp:Transcript_27835/g.88423  ORF Transcript_27835/g.88423 Transcript_27835/m.88423 type:complete len:814 (+) Transcript_27835:163-2604(+)
MKRLGLVALATLAAANALSYPEATCQTVACRKTGNLTGMHLEITAIHATDFLDMGYDDESRTDLNDPEEWQGFLIDVLKWLQEKAGFTYTLKAPSGEGENCDVGDFNTTKDYAVQYNCGSDDVFSLNKSHVYLGMYYMTAARLASGYMTVPFLSDVGVSVVVPVKTSTENSLTKVFDPFTPYMWILTLLTVIYFALVLSITEHSYTKTKDGAGTMPDAKKILDQRFWKRDNNDGKIHLQDDYEKNLSRRHDKAAGLFTWKAYTRALMRILPQSFLAMTAHDHNHTYSYSGRFFNVVFCMFALIWVAAYTANLAAFLSFTSTDSIPAETLADIAVEQAQGDIGPACVKGSTAYAAFLADNFPDIETLTIPGSYDDLFDALKDGTCGAIVDAYPFAEWMEHQPSYCEERLQVAGQPLSWGPVDMAIGVGEDYSHVADGLNYWLQTLRACGRLTVGSACYKHGNTADLYEDWVRQHTCKTSGTGTEGENEKLTPTNFLLPFTLVWGYGIFLLLKDLTSREAWMRVKGMCSKNYLVKYIKDNFPECIHMRKVSVDAFMRVWRADDVVRNELHPLVQDHFLRTDIAAYRFYVKTVNLYTKAKAHLLDASEDETDRESYEELHYARSRDHSGYRSTTSGRHPETPNNLKNRTSSWFSRKDSTSSELDRIVSELSLFSEEQEKDQLEAIRMQAEVLVRRAIHETLSEDTELEVQRGFDKWLQKERERTAREAKREQQLARNGSNHLVNGINNNQSNRQGHGHNLTLSLRHGLPLTGMMRRAGSFSGSGNSRRHDDMWEAKMRGSRDGILSTKKDTVEETL